MTPRPVSPQPGDLLDIEVVLPAGALTLSSGVVGKRVRHGDTQPVPVDSPAYPGLVGAISGALTKHTLDRLNDGDATLTCLFELCLDKTGMTPVEAKAHLSHEIIRTIRIAAAKDAHAANDLIALLGMDALQPGGTETTNEGP